jgi:hypothetical protein
MEKLLICEHHPDLQYLHFLMPLLCGMALDVLLDVFMVYATTACAVADFFSSPRVSGGIRFAWPTIC